jgi:hypothetical protein
MYLDTRDYPKDYILSEVVADKLGIYVNYAAFVTNKDQTTFRVLVDSQLDKVQLARITGGKVWDGNRLYHFSYLEVLEAPVVDNVPRMKPATSYIRLTFI